MSSLFFPPALRDEVFVFYSFVRTVDDLVDCVPPKLDEFYRFKQEFRQAIDQKITVNNPLIDDFVALMNRRQLPHAWVEAFFLAMKADLTKTTYHTLAELEAYMYGSAEVIGLIMAKLIGLPKESYTEAQMLGRAFQYINFIRDLAEDTALGRRYIPTEIITEYGFTSLSYEETLGHPVEFNKLIRQELARYEVWQAEGELGFRFIPRRFLIPIKTAACLYRFTATRIARRPQIILEGAVKPSLPRILYTLLQNFFSA